MVVGVIGGAPEMAKIHSWETGQTSQCWASRREGEVGVINVMKLSTVRACYPMKPDELQVR